ncbi:MAG: DUF4468 domain-containing protein [Chitinophagaceae bacterium]|nr:DUF4468 domain-containing protein [Chitinophagaceae bacterium]MDP1763415.1 DUF4468 domain-containing protein [Sediminibacterium sp.]
MNQFISLFLLASLSIAVSAQSQQTKNELPIDSTTHKYTFTEVIQVKGASDTELYSRARFFVSDIFKSAKAVTDLQDDVSKTILIKPIIKNRVKSFLVNDPWGYTIYQFTIQCKPGRYRYIITDLYHKGEPYGMRDGGALESEKGNGFTKSTWQQVKEQARIEITSVIELLKNRMNSQKNSDF